MPHEEESWFRNGGLSTSYSIQNSVLQTDGVNAASRDEACIASGVCPAEAEVRTLSQSNTIQNIWNLGLRRAASTRQIHVMFSQMDPNGGINGPLSIRISPSCVQTFSSHPICCDRLSLAQAAEEATGVASVVATAVAIPCRSLYRTS